MKNKKQIKEHLYKALELLKKQTLTSEELRARAMLNIALKTIEESEDADAPKSGAV